MDEETRYYKLNVDDLPRGTAMRWARELSPDGHQRVKVTVMELQGTIYYVAVTKAYVAELFEERLRRRDVHVESTTTAPPAPAARRQSSASSGSSSRSSSRGGFWDDLFDGVGDFFGRLFD
ncbi:MAG TPA: hypothetical protein VFH06_04300 [Candidatus Saccharimonadales bacterium]|nr:hypothetical protein [Candidatus Saccharimonadales bacterium]